MINKILLYLTKFYSLISLKKIIFCLFFILISSFISLYKNDVLANKYNNNFNKHIIKESIKQEVHDYINKYASDSRMDIDTFVNICLEYKLDICFALAQGHLESHFGTKGLALITNSIFNVGSFTDGTIINTYHTPTASIKPYVLLVTSKYLDKKKTINDLLNSYTSKKGYRYASSEAYENMLKIIYSKLIVNTKINQLQEKYDYDE